MGIKLTKVAAQTPESNRAAARVDRTLLEKARAIIKKAGMS